MATVITDSKHYGDIASKIRSVFGVTTAYKPSEMSSVISDMKDLADKFGGMENGLAFGIAGAKIIGMDKMYPYMLAGSEIESFEVPENITEIPQSAFEESKIENIILHDGIILLGSKCFYDCEKLTSVRLPSSLVTISDEAFYMSKIAGELIIPSSVTTIGSTAFSYTDITLLDIPATVSIIPEEMCYSCGDLKNVILRRTESICTLEDVSAFDCYYFDYKKTGYFYVPAALVDSYKADSTWATFADQIRAIEDYPDICG